MNQNWKANYKKLAWLNINRINHHIPFLDLQGKRVLDLGCWWGWFIRYARDQGAQVVGFDYDKKSIIQAGEFLQNKEGLSVATAEQIPYKIESFDIFFRITFWNISNRKISWLKKFTEF